MYVFSTQLLYRIAPKRDSCIMNICPKHPPPSPIYCVYFIVYVSLALDLLYTKHSWSPWLPPLSCFMTLIYVLCFGGCGLESTSLEIKDLDT